MISANQRDMIGGGLRLTILGALFYYVISTTLMKSMDLLYPYLNPTLINRLIIWSIVGYIIPGILFIVLSPFGKYLDRENVIITDSKEIDSENSLHNNKLPLTPKILMIIASLMACVGILGVRNGIMLILHIKNAEKKQNKEQNKNQEHKTKNLKNAVKEGISSFKVYIFGGASYLLVFGLFFLAIVEFIQVVEVDLAYPIITQKGLMTVWNWIWISFITPSILYFILIFWIKNGQSNEIRKKQRTLLVITAILSISSIFGLTIGINSINSWWMVDSNQIILEESEKNIESA